MTAAELRVSCPDCGQPMVARRNKATGGEFLGCSQFPRCTATQEIPTYVKLIRQGAQQLPGFAGDQ